MRFSTRPGKFIPFNMSVKSDLQKKRSSPLCNEKVNESKFEKKVR
jgi:hypothetical protein